MRAANARSTKQGHVHSNHPRQQVSDFDCWNQVRSLAKFCADTAQHHDGYAELTDQYVKNTSDTSVQEFSVRGPSSSNGHLEATAPIGFLRSGPLPSGVRVNSKIVP